MPKGVYTRTEQTRENIRKAMLGKVPSKATREKISKANKGKKKPEGFSEKLREIAIKGEYHKNLIPFYIKPGDIPWCKGKKLTEEQCKNRKHTEEWKKAISKRMTGDKHPMWKGGISKDENHKREMRKKWQRENPIKTRLNKKVQSLKRRAHKYIKRDVLQKVYEDNIKKYGELTCVLCFKPVKFGEDSIEHLQPICKGGTSDISNLAIAHYKCNTKKNRKTLQEWRDKCQA